MRGGDQEGKHGLVATNMEVTRVKIQPTADDLVRAYVDITLNDRWVIRGLKVIRYSSGYLVAMPRNKPGDDTSQEIVLPTDQKLIHEAVMSEYRKTIAGLAPKMLH
jgi:DNA-binding cell septation regulator SpoVG